MILSKSQKFFKSKGAIIMNKNELEKYLKEGLSTRDIEKITGLNYRTISYWINKYELNNLSMYKKNPNYKFNKIDSREKAYVLGFMLADSAIANSKCEISVAIRDKEVAELIAKTVNANIHYDMTYNKETRRFPRARISKKISDITKFTGGERKKDRHYPIVNNELERYLLQGFFEADGCVAWGYRKDKNRIWHKISMKSSLSILTGVQSMLLKKLSIATKLYPVKDEDCYCIEFANKQDVLKFLNYIYPDNQFIVLNRKYLKQNALRLELGENGEGHNGMDNTVPSLQEQEGVETSGEMATFLNNRTSAQALCG